MKHRGEIVEKAVRESAYPITKLALRLGVSRRHVYNVFENDKVDWDTILDIGAIIRYDFTKDFPELKQARFEALQERFDLYGPANRKNNKRQAPMTTEEELNNLKNRYIELLEKYNELLKTHYSNF